MGGMGGRGGVQVAVDDVLDGHVIGAVHEMIAAHDAVSLLAHVPGTRGEGVGGIARRCACGCEENARASRPRTFPSA
jgi:hypothetical protein